MPKYLVTGAAGFIGSRVAARLLERGDEVVGIDSLNDAYDPRLKAWRLERLQERGGFGFERADVTDSETLDGLCRRHRFRAVLHLAARAGVRQSIEDPAAYIETNVRGTLNVLERCRACGISQLVLASTSSLYGARNPLPFGEDADTSYPLSPYAASKKAAEALAHSFHHLYGLPIAVLRFFTVYGPAGRPDMSVFRFIRWICEGEPVLVYGDGSQSRDFTYVDDIARGTVAALELPGYEVINLGSDAPTALRDALRLIEERLGREARILREPFPRADMAETWANIAKARRLLGWQPETSLRRGLELTVDWYLENRTWASRLRL